MAARRSLTALSKCLKSRGPLCSFEAVTVNSLRIEDHWSSLPSCSPQNAQLLTKSLPSPCQSWASLPRLPFPGSTLAMSTKAGPSDPSQKPPPDPGTTQESARGVAEGTKEVDREEPQPVQVILSPEPTSPVSTILHYLSGLKTSLFLWIYKHAIEKDFDLQNFLEGAQHAYSTVTELFAKGDFKAMERMVSPVVLNAFQATFKMYEAQEMSMDIKVEEVQDVQLVHSNVEVKQWKDWGVNHLEELEGYVQDHWLTFTVQIDCRERWKLLNKAGEVVKDTVDMRGHRWMFARSLPLKKNLPVDELESPWIVVDIK